MSPETLPFPGQTSTLFPLRKFLLFSFLLHLIVGYLLGILQKGESPPLPPPIPVYLAEDPFPSVAEEMTAIDFTRRTEKEEEAPEEGLLSWQNNHAHSLEGKKKMDKAGGPKKRHPSLDDGNQLTSTPKSQISEKGPKSSRSTENPSRKKIEKEGDRVVDPSLPPRLNPDPSLKEQSALKAIKSGTDSQEETFDSEPISLDTQEFKFIAYFAEIKRKIDSVWVYPVEAITRGDGGTSLIRFEIKHDGSLKRAVVYNSSGRKVLDKESLNAVANAAPFPPIPEEIGSSHLNIVATFSYSMNFVAQ